MDVSQLDSCSDPLAAIVQPRNLLEHIRIILVELERIQKSVVFRAFFLLSGVLPYLLVPANTN